ncbi:MAG: hydroxyacid dehydrogenase [Bacteroidetes bacterium]|jgi:D-lactate dehydrogenase|nr:hydroxyacid dehydrogenase [Bacteroidota bacterium]
MDVYFYEAFAEEAEALKRLLPPTVSCEYSWKTIQESGHSSPRSTIVSIRTQSVIPSDWAGQMEGVLSRSTGYDHLRAFRARVPVAVPCGYLEEYATRAVAEHALLMVMCLLRRLPLQQEQVARFERNGLTGRECQGLRLLVVGVGRIGSETVRLAKGIGMDVRGVDIVHRHKDVHYVEREEGIRWADAIVCAMNLTHENRGYFNAERMRLARPGIIFVNIARGEHSPLEDLRQLTHSGHLGGLGLDVFEDEPAVAGALRDPSSPRSPGADIVRELLMHPNVLCTPHNAFNTLEAVERKAAFTVTQIQHFLKHRDFLWKV